MKKELLKYLCCPSCKSDFKLEVFEKRDSDVVSGKLFCKHCFKSYDVVDSIPVILDKKQLKDFSKTKQNWENWWTKVREKSDIDLYDKLWNQAEKNLGGEPLLRKKDFENKVVLDAGCGNGRYIKSDLSKYGCKEIIAVDIGHQVFLARENNKELSNVHYIQADLTNLPLKKECVDVILSHGVLHHTPDPKDTFSRLTKHLKVNGLFSVYVYHKEWAYFKTHKKSLLLDAVYANGILIWQGVRKVVSRLPHPLLFAFVYCMAVKSSIVSYLQNTKYLNKLGSALQLLPPFAYIGVNFHERLVRNYDHYSATFNYFFSIDEVVDWFEMNSFNNLEICSVPVSIKGYKQRKHAKPLNIKEYPILGHFEFRREWESLFEKSKQAKFQQEYLRRLGAI